MSNARIQYNIDDGSGGSDVGMYVALGADRHLDISLISDCRHVVESLSLVSILFREVFTHYTESLEFLPALGLFIFKKKSVASPLFKLDP